MIMTLAEDVDILISFMKEKRLQGVICLGGNFTEIDEDSFENIDVPIVITSVNTISNKGKENYSSVGIDDVKAAYDATKYIINKGHKNIAMMIGEKNDIGISWWRYRGFVEALKKTI